VASTVDLLVVLHNSKHTLPALFKSLRTISVPVMAYFLDNNSADGTPEFAVEALEHLPFPAYVTRSLRNHGFAGGMNLLARMSSAEFMFILNPDAEVEPGCLETLLRRALADSRAGICEARQVPREHPKASDPETGETTWCSGAASLIRRNAFDEVGGFDEEFFMYCEDVDLSWKLWLKGWKCLYVPEASVKHRTQDLMPGKKRTHENYFSFRNTLFLIYRFGGARRRELMLSFLVRRFWSGSYSTKSKLLFLIALVDHIRYIPYLIQSRDVWSSTTHRWVRFEETSVSQ
jgi:GT2 family glycosyltransferase